jgi:hypothetical protein
MLIGPRVQGDPCEFRSVVQDHGLRPLPSGKKPIQNAADALPTNGVVDFNL